MHCKYKNILLLLSLTTLLSCSEGSSASNTDTSENINILNFDDVCKKTKFNTSYNNGEIEITVSGNDNNIFTIKRSEIAYPSYNFNGTIIFSGNQANIQDPQVDENKEYFYSLFYEINNQILPCISSSSISNENNLDYSNEIDTFKQVDLPNTDTSFDLLSRIPVILSTRKGALLAFAERREGSPSDSSPKSIVLSKSFDNGKSWSDYLKIIEDGMKSVGNPTAIYDENLEKITLLFSVMHENATEELITSGVFDAEEGIRIKKITSYDDGHTWSESIDITDSISRDNARFINVGPGIGIIDRNGKYIFPAYDSINTIDQPGNASQSFMIVSSDNGESFSRSSSIDIGSDENQIVELEDGSLKAFIRFYGDKKFVATSTSIGSEIDWTSPIYDANLPSSIVQQSVIRLSNIDEYLIGRIIFSNPIDQARRDKMAIKISLDETNRWSYQKIIDEVSGDHPDFNIGYSCLTVLNDKTIGILYEKYDDFTHSIIFSRYNIEFLSNNEDRLILR